VGHEESQKSPENMAQDGGFDVVARDRVDAAYCYFGVRAGGEKIAYWRRRRWWMA
jgi:hypothetical protein